MKLTKNKNLATTLVTLALLLGCEAKEDKKAATATTSGSANFSNIVKNYGKLKLDFSTQGSGTTLTETEKSKEACLVEKSYYEALSYISDNLKTACETNALFADSGTNKILITAKDGVSLLSNVPGKDGGFTYYYCSGTSKTDLAPMMKMTRTISGSEITDVLVEKLSLGASLGEIELYSVLNSADSNFSNIKKFEQKFSVGGTDGLFNYLTMSRTNGLTSISASQGGSTGGAQSFGAKFKVNTDGTTGFGSVMAVSTTESDGITKTTDKSSLEVNKSYFNEKGEAKEEGDSAEFASGKTLDITEASIPENLGSAFKAPEFSAADKSACTIAAGEKVQEIDMTEGEEAAVADETSVDPAEMEAAQKKVAACTTDLAILRTSAISCDVATYVEGEDVSGEFDTSEIAPVEESVSGSATTEKE